MCFLYLIEQEHAVRRLTDGIGEQTALFISHISCRRTDKLSHGVLLCVFTHVEADEFYAHFLCEDAAYLSLADAGRTDK